MAKGLPTLKERPHRASGLQSPPVDRALTLKLTIEMNHIARDVFSTLGVSPEEQRIAAVQARKIKKGLWPGALLLMAVVNGVGGVLSTWRHDKRYA